jgi:choline dehydrogenase-like flavoprotein
LIVDLLSFPENHLLETDLCVIGAGAAGISVAEALRHSGLEVILLEAGGLKHEPDTQALYAGSVVDPRLHSPPERYRERRFGGTTTIWGGRCMPFDEIDFEPRDYVAYSGWPLARADLLPFYPEANRLCEAGHFAYTVDAAFRRSLRPMLKGFASSHFTTDTLERFSCPTDFGRRYGHRLAAAANLRVILHANVTALRLDPTGTHTWSLEVRHLGGRRLTVRARLYVLATGGLEVARLLLASRDVQPSGVGNDRDLVGRFYMCHLAGTIGRIQIYGPRENAWHGYDLSDEGVYCRRRLALTAATQRALRLGNFIARLHHPRITDPAHRNAVLSLLYLAKSLVPYEYAKRLYGDDAGGAARWLQHLRNVVGGPHEAIAFAWHMLRDRRLAERKFPSIIIRSRANLYSLDFHSEQEPNPSSRVRLGSETDALGMPRLEIDWRYTAGDVKTVSRSLGLLAEDLRQSGSGRFDFDPSEVELEMTRYGAYGGHHIGTARMGTDPRTSVVDPNGRVHGIDNLFVTGAATFPTSSQANPTLTIVALALRLASHLRQRLER